MYAAVWRGQLHHYWCAMVTGETCHGVVRLHKWGEQNICFLSWNKVFKTHKGFQNLSTESREIVDVRSPVGSKVHNSTKQKLFSLSARLRLLKLIYTLLQFSNMLLHLVYMLLRLNYLLLQLIYSLLQLIYTLLKFNY